MLGRIEESAKTIWLHPWTGWALISGIACFCGYYWLYPQPIGYAVTVLCSAVSIMSFREMPHTQKVLMTIAIFVLAFAELKNIRSDQVAHDLQINNDKIAEDKRFSGLLKTQQDNFERILAQNQQEFQQTLKDNREIAGIAKRSLNNIVGTDSIPYIVPQLGPAPINLVMWVDGKNILSGVTAIMYNFREDGVLRSSEIPIGVVHPGWPRDLGITLSPHPNKKVDGSEVDAYTIYIYTQSDLFTEELQFREGKNGQPWASRYWVTKSILSERTHSLRVLHKFIPKLMDPKFMRKDSSAAVTVLSQGNWSDDKPGWK